MTWVRDFSWGAASMRATPPSATGLPFVRPSANWHLGDHRLERLPGFAGGVKNGCSFRARPIQRRRSLFVGIPTHLAFTRLKLGLGGLAMRLLSPKISL